MIKTGDFTIYYGGKRKPFIFLFSKTSVQMAVFNYTESTLQINHHGPVLEQVQGHVGGSRAPSDALVRVGTSPLTIKYIWSPRVSGEATAGLSSLAPRPCLLRPRALLWRGRLPSAKGKGSSLHLRPSRIRKGQWRCPVGVGRNSFLPTPSILCPAQRW